jgi:hypothetical protein
MSRFQLLTSGFVGGRSTNSATPLPFYSFCVIFLYTSIETALKAAQKIALALPFYFKNSILLHGLASAVFCAVVSAVSICVYGALN